MTNTKQQKQTTNKPNKKNQQTIELIMKITIKKPKTTPTHSHTHTRNQDINNNHYGKTQLNKTNYKRQICFCNY